MTLMFSGKLKFTTFFVFKKIGLYYFVPVEMIGVIVLTLNRFTSVALPLKHESVSFLEKMA